MGTTITALTARRLWDSRGNPTVEAEVTLSGGAVGRAIAPAGASRGTRETIDLRDGGTVLRGQDVGRAVANVRNRIAPALIEWDARDLTGVDAAMLALDGSPMLGNLGGNATVAVSLAVLHAAAAAARAISAGWLYDGTRAVSGGCVLAVAGRLQCLAQLYQVTEVQGLRRICRFFQRFLLVGYPNFADALTNTAIWVATSMVYLIVLGLGLGRFRFLRNRPPKPCAALWPSCSI